MFEQMASKPSDISCTNEIKFGIVNYTCAVAGSSSKTMTSQELSNYFQLGPFLGED